MLQFLFLVGRDLDRLSKMTTQGELKERIADFVHGADGLGNTYPTLSDRKPIDTFAPDYLIQKVNEFPGEITIVALGPLTNLAAVNAFDTGMCLVRICIQHFVFDGEECLQASYMLNLGSRLS